MRFARFCTPCLIAALWFFAVPAARAAYTINIQQVGPDVVATGSGSINTGGLTIFTPLVTTDGAVGPNTASVAVGPTGISAGNSTLWHTISGGPSSFGPGTFASANSGSGAPVGIVGSQGFLITPENYSGSDLGTSTDTWSNQTFTSLGLIPGSYVYSLPNDTFTVNVLPEPASFSLLTIAGVAMLRRSRSQRQGEIS